MPTLHISVFEKIASYQKRDGDIVCGNSDYSIEFLFDDAWKNYSTKTARFIWNGKYKDIEFTGTVCTVPIINDTDTLEVGVYAGNLSTTTRAVIGCKRSVLCGKVSSFDGEEAEEEYTSDAKTYAAQAASSASSARSYAVMAESAATRAESAASSSLPTVTKADKGKVLTVNSNGIWVASTLPTYNGEYEVIS